MPELEDPRVALAVRGAGGTDTAWFVEIGHDDGAAVFVQVGDAESDEWDVEEIRAAFDTVRWYRLTELAYGPDGAP